jgi:lipoprotein NlpD
MHRVPPLRSLAGRAAGVVLVLALAACASRGRAPVEERRATPARPGTPPVAAPAPASPPSVAAPTRAAEPDWRPPSYTVKRGDTLHAIALEHGLDYRELAAWNNLDNPNVIRVGQLLRLAPPGETPGTPAPDAAGVQVAPLRTAPPVVEARPAASPPPLASAPPTHRSNTDALKVAPRAIKEPYSEKAAQEMAKTPPDTQVARAEPARPLSPAASPSGSPTAPAVPASPSPAQPGTPAPVPEKAVPSPAPSAPPSNGNGAADDAEDLDWTWPAKGKLVTGFSDTANLKGIDIAGTAGQAIVASAPGRVVYAGSGLRGYGKLVIIKHNKTFLSAYAHNREIVVKEGQQVTRGQKIAEMGSTDTDQVKLHFEIRRLGRPMDPMKYLPPA